MAKRTKRPAGRKMKPKGGKARTRILRKPKRAVPRKARKTAKKTGKRVVTKARGSKRTTARQRKQAPKLTAGAVETTIVDMIEEPLPGIVTVTEFEAERVALPDADEANED
jgi:hypothetical protein